MRQKLVDSISSTAINCLLNAIKHKGFGNFEKKNTACQLKSGPMLKHTVRLTG